MKTILLTISATINTMFVLAIIVAFKTGFIEMDAPQRTADIDAGQYAMILAQSSKEAKADIFSVMDRKHR